MNTEHYKRKQQSTTELDHFTRKQLRLMFHQEKRERWEQMLEKEHGVPRRDSGQNRVRKMFYLLAGVAAVIVLLFFFLQPAMNSPSPQSTSQLTAQLLEAERFPNLIVSKGHASVSEMKLNAAEAYNKSDYTLAITLGEQIVADSEVQAVDWFYLALSYLYDNNYKEAIRCFGEVRQLKALGLQYQQETNWFMALSYLQTGAVEQAEKELKGIIASKGWQSEKAQFLLSKLEEK